MKKLLFFSIAFFSIQTIFAQPAAQVSREADGTKILKGFISKKEISADTSFNWFAQNQLNYKPNADVVKQYAANKDSVNIIVFGGTWCSDTQHLLPHFYATVDAAGFPDNRITLIGVDRSKKTFYNLAEAFGVINVPTFIVMKNGKEIGRVVEYGRIGVPEKEVAEIIVGAEKK